jgi:hypothetical protein
MKPLVFIFALFLVLLLHEAKCNAEVIHKSIPSIESGSTIDTKILSMVDSEISSMSTFNIKESTNQTKFIKVNMRRSLVEGGKKIESMHCSDSLRPTITEKLISLNSVVIKTPNENNEIIVGKNVLLEALWVIKSPKLDIKSSKAIIQLLSMDAVLMAFPLSLEDTEHETFELTNEKGVTTKYYKTVLRGVIPPHTLRRNKSRTFNIRMKAFPNGIYDDCYLFEGIKVGAATDNKK